MLRRTSLQLSIASLLLAALPVYGDPLVAAVTGGVTLSAQHACDPDVKSEALASFDLLVVGPYLGGEWTLHAEGSTTPREGYVADTVSEANTDAGTVMTADHHGHLQISEIKYLYTFDESKHLTVGVIEAAAYLDTAETAIDENTQFMGISFKHNLAIEFPDYALGVVYQSQFVEGGPLLTFALSSSHGLADNPSASYAQALNIDAKDKGAFIATSSLWRGEAWHGEIGAWGHTAPHDTLDGTSHEAYNYGIFGLLGRAVEQHAFDLRLGVANPEVSQVKLFTALSYELRKEAVVYGIGAARTFLSDDAKGPGRANMSQYELYARIFLGKGLELTPHVQHIDNSNFDASNTLYSNSLNLIGVRLVASI